MKVVVILPTYNEKENIVAVLDGLVKATAPLSHHQFLFLVVDDTSPDGTREAVLAYQKKDKRVSVISGKKEGLGRALLRGMTHAVETLHADVILQMDADLSHNPASVPLFIRAIDDGADFVVGSRYIPSGSIPNNWGIHRKIFSIVGNAIVRFGLGYPKVHDWTGGFRAYHTRFYEQNASKVRKYSGYVFQIAFLHNAVKSGAHIVEVPIQFTDRRYGHSKIAPAEYIRNVLWYVGSSRIESLREGTFGKFLVVGGTGFALNAIILVLLHELAHWAATPSNLAGAAVAIFSNFNLNNMWTFKHQKVSGIESYLGKLAQFYATSIFGVVVIQTGTIELGVRLMGDGYYFLYFLFGTGLLLIWNYTVYSKFIWKNP